MTWFNREVPNAGQFQFRLIAPLFSPALGTSLIYYTELYACVTDFDKETLQGTLIGFDCLGKILLGGFGLKGLTRVQDIRQALLEKMVLFDVKYEDDDKSDSRKNECGILNFDFSFDENGAPIFEYDPIW